MDIIEGLKTRRSVRRFDTTKKVSREDIEKIIEAAAHAPSAHNTQPWHFVVIEDKEQLAALHTLQPWTAFAKDASCVILVCADSDVSFHREKETDQWSYADIDGTLAAYGVLLAAHDLGYGACFCGAAPMPLVIEKLQERFALPQNIRPVAIIPVGVPPASSPAMENRYNPERVDWEKW
jgi:nitroreductase